MSLFDHCTTAAEAWKTYYSVACMCDAEDDMRALTAQAEKTIKAFDDDSRWPFAGASPKPYDIFNMFVRVAARNRTTNDDITDIAGYTGYEAHTHGKHAPYAAIDWGRVELVARAQL